VIGVAEQSNELTRHDLPRNAEAVFHPPALLGLGYRRQRVAEALDVGLSLDGYLERDRLVELELRPPFRPVNGRPISVNSTKSTSPALPDG
jgi:hypothetical protein